MGLSRAVTIRFMVFGEITVALVGTKGDKGSCRKAGEEATVRVHKEIMVASLGGRMWGCRCGGSGCRYN